MKTLNCLMSALILTSAIPSAFANQLSAKHCEIYMSQVMAAPSSHGFEAVRVSIQVGYLGDGETIQKVGYFGTTTSQDLGNPAECHSGPSYPAAAPMSVVAFTSPTNNGSRYGEYSVDLPVYSGTVLDQCPGYAYSTQATFFVETNKNTYWLNPSLDANQYFTFDRNGFDILQSELGDYNMNATTSSPNLSYYNPGSCQ